MYPLLRLNRGLQVEAGGAGRAGCGGATTPGGGVPISAWGPLQVEAGVQGGQDVGVQRLPMPGGGAPITPHRPLRSMTYFYGTMFDL